MAFPEGGFTTARVTRRRVTVRAEVGVQVNMMARCCFGVLVVCRLSVSSSTLLWQNVFVCVVSVCTTCEKQKSLCRVDLRLPTKNRKLCLIFFLRGE